jgi:hypothetical protein
MKTLSKFSEKSLKNLLALTGQKGRTYLRLAKFKSLLSMDLFGGKTFQQSLTMKPDTYIRKLALVEDPELKARIVAIFDHFSQNILNLLSKQVFDILKSLPCDRTFTQSPFFNHEGYEVNDDKYHSLDLTAATDRFPLSLQLQILKSLGLTQEQAHA